MLARYKVPLLCNDFSEDTSWVPPEIFWVSLQKLPAALRVPRSWLIFPCTAVGLCHVLCMKEKSQRKTKGQEVKGKIVSALFSHFFILLQSLLEDFPQHTFSEFIRKFSPGLFLQIKGVLFKENKRE